MRLFFKSILIVLLLCIATAAVSYWFIQQQLAKLPIANLQYSISNLSVSGITIEQLQFSLPAQALEVEIDTLTLSVQWPSLFQPKLQGIVLKNSLLYWQQLPFANETQSEPSKQDQPLKWDVPQWLPQHVTIEQMLLDLPCHITRCRYVLQANIDNALQSDASSAQLNYQLTLADNTTPAIERVSVNGLYRTEQHLPVIDARLAIEQSIVLRLTQQLKQETQLVATGEINLNLAPPSKWLLKQLQQWHIELPDSAVKQFTSPVAIISSWQWYLPPDQPLKTAMSKASGNWQLTADLPSPVMLPGIGQLQGNVDASLTLNQGELSQYKLHSVLQVLNPQLPNFISDYGIDVNKLTLVLNASEQHKPQLTALPVSLQLHTEGQTKLSIDAEAVINATPPISGRLHSAKLKLDTKQLAGKQFTIEQLQAGTSFNAHWLVDRWQLQLTEFDATAMQPATTDINAKKLTINTDKLTLTGDSLFTGFTGSGNLMLNVDELQHPALKAQSWQWQGNLNGLSEQLQAEGTLSNTAGLTISHQLSYQPDHTQVTWQLAEVFLLAGNPLKDSFAAWPSLLDLQRGKLQASGNASVTADNITSHNELQLYGISGIYDRSIFSGLTASPVLDYQSSKLTLYADDVMVEEIQHGVQLGPVRTSASYTAPIDNLLAGTLDLRQLSLNAMGGTINAEPAKLDLSKLQPQRVQLNLQQIDLSKILQQHPSTDLSGNGQISGTIPLVISQQGISVEKGQLAAESPGGKLQYRPDGAKGMAQNPGMKVLVEALDDFHYSVLASDVTYSSDGKLILGLKLQGKNPALEHGRPINFNINLEEDIPALLTSLQLSSKISDKIKQRIQQRLQQREAAASSGDNP